MRTECHRGKKPVLRCHTKASQESSENNSIDKVQLKKKRQERIAFEHFDKKIKVPPEKSWLKRKMTLLL